MRISALFLYSLSERAIFTEWAQIRDFDILRYKELMTHPIILDGRNCYPSHNFKNTGIIYDSVGRRTVQ